MTAIISKQDIERIRQAARERNVDVVIVHPHPENMKKLVNWVRQDDCLRSLEMGAINGLHIYESYEMKPDTEWRRKHFEAWQTQRKLLQGRKRW